MLFPVTLSSLLLLAVADVKTPKPETAEREIKALGGRVYRYRNGSVSVTLKGRHIHDSHLQLLLAFPNVKDLDLRDANISDAGLDTLLKLEKLEEVRLERTQVTREGAERLKRRHSKIYHVAYEARFKPIQLVLAGVFLIPMILGAWMIAATNKKRNPDIPLISYGSTRLGVLLIAGSAVLMAITALQAVGMDVKVSNLFD